MPDKQIFFDPGRKRWKRLRRVLDAVAVVSTLVVAGFIFNSLRLQRLPELLLPVPKHNYRALRDRTPLLKRVHAAPPSRRKTGRRPSDIPLNSGEGLRAAFYVPYDATSYSSFKEHVHQIDMLFPDWLHVNGADPQLFAMSSENTLLEYPVIDNGHVRDPDDLNKIKRVITETREGTEVFPHLTNFSPTRQLWDPAVGDLLGDPEKRSKLEAELMQFFTALPFYRGLSLDFENLHPGSYPQYAAFVQDIYGQLRARNLRLYINVGVGTPDNLLKQL